MKTVIIGAGNIAYPHARALRELGIGIEGILDLDNTKAKTLAEQFNSKVINSIDEELSQVDMVHIFTPPAYRVEYVRKAAEAGKHIFIEKPIAISIKDAKGIVKLADQNKVKLMIGYNHRFRLGYKMLEDAVRNGSLGDIISVFTNRMGIGGGTGLNTNWRTSLGSVCGMTIESLSHDIDMMLYLVDGVISVKANTYGTIPELPQFDNNAAVTFRLKNGGIGSINASWCSRIGYSSRGVIGTKGTAMLTGNKMFNFLDFSIKTEDMTYETVTRIDDQFETEKDQFDSPSYFMINEDFIKCIEMDLVPAVTGEDGLRALVFSKAILESDSTGQEVKVNI